MTKLSTGQPSTLGSYLKLCEVFFGNDSVQARFIRDKIATHANGADEEVIAEENQMIFLLMNLKSEANNDMGNLLK